MEVRAAARQAPRSVHGDTAVGAPYKADQPLFAGLFPAGDAGPHWASTARRLRASPFGGFAATSP